MNNDTNTAAASTTEQQSVKSEKCAGFKKEAKSYLKHINDGVKTGVSIGAAILVVAGAVALAGAIFGVAEEVAAS